MEKELGEEPEQLDSELSSASNPLCNPGENNPLIHKIIVFHKQNKGDELDAIWGLMAKQS